MRARNADSSLTETCIHVHCMKLLECQQCIRHVDFLIYRKKANEIIYDSFLKGIYCYEGYEKYISCRKEVNLHFYTLNGHQYAFGREDINQLCTVLSKCHVSQRLILFYTNEFAHEYVDLNDLVILNLMLKIHKLYLSRNQSFMMNNTLYTLILICH